MIRAPRRWCGSVQASRLRRALRGGARGASGALHRAAARAPPFDAHCSDAWGVGPPPTASRQALLM
eukprot:8700791-Alexandrium_andersonii.AAC.1